MKLIHNKYLFALLTAMRFQLSSKAQLIARISLYSMIVYLFSQVFTTVHGEDERLWYVATTQLITLSVYPLAFKIANDLFERQYEYFLLKPFSYLPFRYCEAIGASLVQYGTLFICYFILCTSLTDKGPEIGYLLPAFLYGIISIAFYTMITAVIGLFSFWIKDIKNVYFLNLTAAFCFGGLIVPLESYPEVMRQISFCTPYPWILWAPAAIMNNKTSFSEAIACIGLWIVLFYGLLRILSKRTQQIFLQGNI